MTPEQIAAATIAATIARTRSGSLTATEIARLAVQDMSASGLIITTAERAVQLLDSERLAAAITREAGNDHAVAALTAAREKTLAREAGL